LLKKCENLNVSQLDVSPWPVTGTALPFFLFKNKEVQDLRNFVKFTKYHYDNQTKEREIGGVRNMHREHEKGIHNFIRESEDKRPLGRSKLGYH
jgi:hypothetical protein